MTRFIGRQKELSDVKRLLAESRLLTFSGTGGCGKTRLALRLAEMVSPEYTDGVYWIELARVADPELIPQTIAKVLHIGEQSDLSSLERLRYALQDRNLLLVLEN